MNRKIGVILSYVLMVLEVLSTLLLTPFILRTLGQAEYGVYKLSAAITAYLLLLDLGVRNAVIRYSAQYRINEAQEDQRKFLGITTIYYGAMALFVMLAGVVLIAVFPTAFAKGLSSDEIKLGQELLLFTTINAAVTLGTAAYASVIVAYERFVVSKGWSILQIILRVLFTIIALRHGMGSVGIVIVHLLMTVLCRFFFVLYVLFGLKIKPLFQGIRLSFVKEIIAYSSWILLQMIATQLNAFVDQVLLGVLVPAASVIIGIYGVGAQIVQYFQSIGSAFTGVLMPGVVRMVQKNNAPDVLCHEMIRIGRIIFSFLSIVWIGFILFGRRFISLWVGDENLDAFYVAVLLITAQLFVITESIGSQIMWARNEHKEQAIMKISVVLLNIVLTVFLIKWKPLIGATIGTFIALLVGDVVVMNIIFKRKLKIRLLSYYGGLFRGIVPCLAIAFVAGWVLRRYLPLSGWLGFAVCVGAMVVVYGTMMLLFGFNKYEKGLLKSIITKVFRRKKHESV